MPDRLQDLLHQRALVQEQLAWLDREIAAAQGIPPLPIKAVQPGGPSAGRPAATNAPVTATGAAIHAPDEAESILRQYDDDALSSAKQARRGVWIIFLLSMALLALGYFLYGAHLGHWW